MAKSLELLEEAPDFKLRQVGGEMFHFCESVKQFEGWHLIIFFRGAWCPVCVQDLKDLEQQRGYFEDKKIRLVTIATDEMTNLENMVEEHELHFPVLHADDLETLMNYGVHYHGADAPYEDHGEHGEPAHFLINETGHLLYQQVQTSPFGRPSATELRKIIQYIKKNLI
ncbi:peroxiredoxin family protein [Exiguobacterium sp. TDN 0502]|uniref:peroxiredoxin family protein n=1 Tax=Exiguobacterium sp. TDN 0502 TaxID=3420731 RepID=UPI003D76DC12